MLSQKGNDNMATTPLGLNYFLIWKTAVAPHPPPPDAVRCMKVCGTYGSDPEGSSSFFFLLLICDSNDTIPPPQFCSSKCKIRSAGWSAQMRKAKRPHFPRGKGKEGGSRYRQRCKGLQPVVSYYSHTLNFLSRTPLLKLGQRVLS